MASGHVNRANRPNTWLHRPVCNVKKVLANSEPSTHGAKRPFVRKQDPVTDKEKVESLSIWNQARGAAFSRSQWEAAKSMLRWRVQTSGRAARSSLRVVSLRRLRAALKDDPGLASALTRHLAHEVHRARAQVEILSLKTVAERVDAWSAFNDCSLPPRGHWRHVASEIGVTAEALYRELAKRRPVA
jgi:hypothetical protein